jgi:hypothetical protein
VSELILLHCKHRGFERGWPNTSSKGGHGLVAQDGVKSWLIAPANRALVGFVADQQADASLRPRL